VQDKLAEVSLVPGAASARTTFRFGLNKNQEISEKELLVLQTTRSQDTSGLVITSLIKAAYPKKHLRKK